MYSCLTLIYPYSDPYPNPALIPTLTATVYCPTGPTRVGFDLLAARLDAMRRPLPPVSSLITRVISPMSSQERIRAQRKKTSLLRDNLACSYIQQ